MKQASLVRVFALVFLFCNGAWAQLYGQNKVQFEKFRWKTIATTHFDISFYQSGDSLARYAAKQIEEMYDSVAVLLDYRLKNRVPIILHNTHAQFEQTNVIRIPLPEAVGGFTEIFKNRIVLPFDGSYASFHHVLHHELVHAVMFNMMRDGGGAMSVAGRMSRFPLWFSEGLAEYGALGWNIGSESFLLDAVTQGYVVSPVHNFGGFLAYKGGQSFLFFVDRTWGRESIAKIVHQIHKGKDFLEAFETATRVSLEEAGELWLRELRRVYWPELGSRQYAKSVSRRLTSHRKDMSFYNLGPKLSPDGKKVAFFSGRGDREGIYILDVETEKVIRAALEGGGSGTHESIHPFSSGVSWAPDSRRLVFVSKKGGKDVLHVLDTDEGDLVRVFEPDLESLTFPDWSRDGEKIVFSGVHSGNKDLYLLELKTEKISKLTHGATAEDRPIFSPSGKFVVYESDADVLRNRAYFDRRSLFILNLETQESRRLGDPRWNSHMASFGSSDSLLTFVSDKSGVNNLYMRDLVSDSLWPVSNLLSGVSSPSWSWGDSLLVYTLFEGGGWDLYIMRDPLEKRRRDTLPQTHFRQVEKDSSLLFFQPVVLENLSSWKDSTDLDSTLADTSETPSRQKSKSGFDGGDDMFMDGSFPKAPEELFYTDTLEDAPDTTDVFPPDSNLKRDSDGKLQVDEADARWSLDQAVALAGMDNIVGFAGQGMLLFSDLMGDQEIRLWFDNQGSDLSRTNFFVGYDYLPYQLDLGVNFYHVYYSTATSRYTLPENVYMDRTLGLGLRLQLPFSRFSRLRLNAGAASRERERLRFGDGGYRRSPGLAGDSLLNLDFDLSWSFDNSQWGIVGPVNGSRYNISLATVPGWTQNQFGFVKAEADFRRYFRWFKKYTLALRFSAGASEALEGYSNPHRYLVGGVVSSFTSRVNNDNYETFATRPGERIFSTVDVPLRGYNLLDFRGTRKLMSNVEFRYPFIREFSIVWPIPIALRYVTGVLFTDLGGAWERGNALDQIGHGFGWGMRANLGIFVLRYTKSWSNHDIGKIRNPPMTYWGLGAEF